MQVKYRKLKYSYFGTICTDAYQKEKVEMVHILHYGGCSITIPEYVIYLGLEIFICLMFIVLWRQSFHVYMSYCAKCFANIYIWTLLL